MNSSQLSLTFILAATLLQIGTCQLVAVKVNATLPTPRHETAAWYDASTDEIYIMGGLHQQGAISQILKYSISTDTLELDSSFPVVRYAGSVSSDAAGNIYYAGGISSDEIFRFSPSTHIVEQVASLPGIRSDSASIKATPSSEEFYILGGFYDRTGIIVVNTTDNSVARLEAELPLNFTNIVATSDGAGMGYIFGTPYGPNDPDLVYVQKMNVSTQEVVPVGAQTFPKIRTTSAAVWDSLENNAYIIGGYGGQISGIRSDSVIKLDPRTEQHTVIAVLNFPWDFYRQEFSGASAVFVERLSRIYFFGGRSQNAGTGFFTLYDGIWYIDL